MATLCIDAGTTLIKAVLFSDDGEELAIATRATTVHSPHPDWSEQHMLEVWDSVEQACLEVISTQRGEITGIAVTAQGDGAWLIDAKGAPIRSAILWNDGRAADVMQPLSADGRLESAWALNGSLSSLGLPNAIMRWLVHHEPQSLASARAVLTCGSWILYKLTGVIGQHPSEASAPWLDINSGEISDALCELYELTAWKHLIPPVLDNAALPINSRLADQWKLAEATPVVMAPYDIVATAAGAGAAHQGDAFAILGTTICPGIITHTPQLDGVHTGLNLLGVGDSQVLRAFPTITGANTLTWLSHIVQVDTVPELTALAEESPVGARGLLWLPYLSPAGERAPFFDPQASGLLFGLHDTHTRADIARSLIESLSYVVRESLEATHVTPSRLGLAGGGAASDLWAQTLADVTGVTTVRSRDAQVGAKGAQIYFSVAVGTDSSVSQATKRLVSGGASFSPAPAHREIHNTRFELFTTLRKAVSPLWSHERGAHGV